MIFLHIVSDIGDFLHDYLLICSFCHKSSPFKHVFMLRLTSALPSQAGSFWDFRPEFGCWHICHVDHPGYFTLQQLRFSLVNETHRTVI